MIDLAKLKEKVSEDSPRDVVVTRSWLKQVLAEISEGREKAKRA